MEQLLQSVLVLSCVGGVLTGALLLLKPLTMRIFGSGWQYCVWLCVLLVMMLPVRFDVPAPTIPAAPQLSEQAIVSSAAPSTGEAALPKPMEAPQVEPHLAITMPRPVSNILAALPSVWLLGALLSFCWNLVAYLRFCHITRRNSCTISCPQLDAVKAELGLRRNIHVRSTGYITAPMMVGLFQTMLLLPDRAMTNSVLRDILRHELTHAKRGDIAFKWFAMLVRCVHWFNPLVYLLCKEFDETCEISCDLAVTDHMDEEGKRGYMCTILSLISPSKVLPLATSMAGGKKQIERRFTMIKITKKPSAFAHVLSIIMAAVLLSTTVFAGGVVANAAALDGSAKTVIQVYNGTEKVTFTNKPFIENDEVYLPLRETLNQFGIADIRWDNGKIDMTLPLLDHYQGGARQEPQGRILIGIGKIWYGEQIDANGYTLRYAPIIRDGITYATVELFENLAFHGQMPWFQVHLKQSSDPKDYVTKGEEVYIGTGEEQDQYRPVDENGNKRYVKRIVTNQRGEAVYVVTVENQRPEKIASMNGVNAASIQGYTKGAEGRSRTAYTNAQGTEIVFSSGIFVYERQGENVFVNIAYIPPTLQINCCAYNQFKLID